MNPELIDRTCQACGEPATTWACDFEEGAPVPSNGSLCRTWDDVGETHYYCNAHFQPPIQYGLSREVEMEIEKLPRGDGFCMAAQAIINRWRGKA